MIYFIIILGFLCISLLFRIMILEAEKQYWTNDNYWRQEALNASRVIKLLLELNEMDEQFLNDLTKQFIDNVEYTDSIR